MRKYENTENGYIIEFDYDPNEQNNQYKKFAEQHEPFKSIICNTNTAKFFRPGFLAYKSCITINNKIPDNVFYFNKIK